MIKYYMIGWISMFILSTVFSRGESDPEAQPNAEPLKIHQILINQAPPPPPPGSLGAPCTLSAECLVANSGCDDSVCACNAGYIRNGAGCIQPGSLGAPCTLSSDCVVSDSGCVDSVCACDEYYVRNNAACIQRKELDDPCDNSVQCPINAECNTNCVCKNNYVTIITECLPELNLGDECLYDLQCSAQTTNSECDTGSPRLCSCSGDLEVAADGSCVPATIGLRMEQPFDDAYHSDMATPGTAQYDALSNKLLSIYQNIPGYVSLTELTMEDNGSGKALTKFLLHVSNPEVASSRVRRDVAAMGGMRESVLSRVRRHAVTHSELRGFSGREIIVRIEKGALHRFCTSDQDCAVVGSTCTQSACSCAFGSVADEYGGVICKRASFY